MTNPDPRLRGSRGLRLWVSGAPGAGSGGRGRSSRRRPAQHDLLSVTGGLAALSLDALSSVAYGPEAIVLVLATAGTVGLGYTFPVTIAIVALLAALIASYRQVIAAFPNGGGAYAVAKAQLGRAASLVAAASLVIDYVLNVAVAVAAGVAALTSAFPSLFPYTVELCLVVLAVITAINLRGVAHSARVFLGPTAVFVGSIGLVIVVGLLRHGPAVAQTGPAPAAIETVGLLLLLKAFSSGCAALSLASIGRNVVFYIVQLSTTVLLALAANTSFGGLPVLGRLLATDNYLPHVFALRADRQVYRYGVGVLAVVSAVLLLVARGDTNTLVPLFAIGVFVGFTLAGVGMVRHWWTTRGPGWRQRLAINGIAAVLTAAATVITTVAKFTQGGWIVVVALPLLVLGFVRIHRAYQRIGERLGVGHIPSAPRESSSLVVVPVHSVSSLAREALSAGLSLGDEVIALRVVYPDEPADMVRFREEWDAWRPDIPLALVDAPHRDLARPIVEFIQSQPRDRRIFILIAEIEPEHLWQRLLRNNRGAVIDRAVRRDTDAIICRLRFRLRPPEPVT